MNALANAVVHAMAFLEFSDDDVIDPDVAVQTMEVLTYDIQKCTAAEKAALKKALEAEHKAQKARKAPKEVLKFYKEFFAHVGLTDP